MQSPNRRTFLKQAGLATAAGATLQCSAGTQRQPNIIYFLADDLGYGDLGCYGQKRIQTPNLDRFATEGVRFTQAYAGSTVCAPSRSVLMTGQHAGHTRIRGNWDPDGNRVPLKQEDVTIAEVLQSAGYKTGIFGKWGLGEPETTGVPNDQGFDEWFGYLNQNHAHNYYPDHLWDNKQRITLDEDTYTHDLFIERSLQFIRDNRDNPFFLFMPITIPHANNELGDETGNGQEVPSDAPYSNENWPQVEKNFAAMVTLMDRDFGRMMDLLKELQLDEDTIVIFTSDNGPHAEGGHDPDFFNSRGLLRGIKRDLYEGGIRVPTMARWPGKIHAGQTSDQVWTFVDVLPTAAELSGARYPVGLDGISIAPSLLDNAVIEREVYWEFVINGKLRQAVRLGDWKAVRYGTNGETELYNLADDIGETRNLAGEHPELIQRAGELFRTSRTESKEFPLPEGA
jgi:arylsulfatase A-like enzyme